MKVANLTENKADLKSFTPEKNTNLSCCKLGSKGRLSNISKELRRYLELETLDLSSNQLVLTDLAYLAHILNSCKELKVLNLAGNLLGLTHKNSYHLTEFAKALASHPHLNELNLSDNHLSSDKLKVILKYLANGCVPLQVLNLSGNNFNSFGIKQVADFVKQNHSLIELNVANNRDSSHKPQNIFYTVFPTTNFRPLLEALQDNNSLKVLDLSNVQLNQEQLAVLSQSLSVNKTLTDFRWSYEDIAKKLPCRASIDELQKIINAWLQKNKQMDQATVSSALELEAGINKIQL